MKKSSKGSPALDEARLRQQAIGARLRQLFDDVVSEPVPDDFLDILRKADDQQTAKDGPHGTAPGADEDA
jgi:hypothetical protein